MALGRVLVIGLDPARIPGYDPTPVQAAIARGRAGAAIAFGGAEDIAEAALRWLR